MYLDPFIPVSLYLQTLVNPRFAKMLRLYSLIPHSLYGDFFNSAVVVYFCKSLKGN